MEIQVGKQSLAFAEAPYIISSASIVGKKESEGPLGNRFDVVGEDDKFGQNTWEEAESTLQKEAFTLAVGKAGLKTEDIRYLFSGDLLGQNIATSFGLMDYQVPLFGLYGACSTCGEALSLGAMCGGGVCRLCCGDDVEPFCQRGKTVPFSAGICQSAPKISDVDGHGERCLRAWEKKKQGAHHGDHDR